MNNIYVEKKPVCCKYCYCSNKYFKEFYTCNILGRQLQSSEINEKRPKKCPLKPLTDRLAEERKKVCDQLKDYITRHYLASIRGSGDIFLELDLTDLNTIFEIIEDGKYESFRPN